MKEPVFRTSRTSLEKVAGFDQLEWTEIKGIVSMNDDDLEIDQTFEIVGLQPGQTIMMHDKETLTVYFGTADENGKALIEK